MDNLITIREASDLLGVSIKTLRRWEQQGKITSIRTPGGHRRYRREYLLQSGQATRTIIGYARVNRPEQKPQLDTQIKALEEFCSQQGQPFEILSDIGNGVSHNHPDLVRLVEMICDGGLACLVLIHPESVGRFCHDFIWGLCGFFKIQVILLNQSQESIAAEDLVDDLQAIVTICYNRLYPLRNPEHQQLVEYLEALKNVR
ncbi:MAG: IS607 family transposase [Microcystis wesenbergii Mw_QC_S_20081001_S30D]|uniref:IS607 family transposase n=1 Tax=Microcystis wesenbergii Mw_QC_S_20081001_S30D TaxID=2486245 RepID=A0A552K0Z3_9CHRO|nr:IS607 family transposase [Microcystis aeruginosa W11-03]NCR92494.1 IS607 family transposase [Microcystis aeruginosa W11-06]TRU97809.1 MAG: IS607 family transposase [Microcystis wesenbergii Mw_QC_B_20070930_S4D]TRU99072.1 MAG: IS607 family transposase [Microcystis wesenbergii Mw_QC_S_20081001_S30]TRV01703.1 MAG: IS607 family transposase [Microcystis wesenbergii Mw_QC_S_20081001_S30D]TRV13084.1 MAG: IS607 family transposase [Microcystis wesenbergii Mw_QC_B_20070930_S4]